MTFIHKYTPYLLLMEVTLSVAFGHEASEELRALLEDFREMVNFAIERALEANVTGYARSGAHI